MFLTWTIKNTSSCFWPIIPRNPVCAPMIPSDVTLDADLASPHVEGPYIYPIWHWGKRKQTVRPALKMAFYWWWWWLWISTSEAAAGRWPFCLSWPCVSDHLTAEENLCLQDIAFMQRGGTTGETYSGQHRIIDTCAVKDGMMGELDLFWLEFKQNWIKILILKFRKLTCLISGKVFCPDLTVIWIVIQFN